jgi:hypothetical protein
LSAAGRRLPHGSEVRAVAFDEETVGSPAYRACRCAGQSDALFRDGGVDVVAEALNMAVTKTDAAYRLIASVLGLAAVLAWQDAHSQQPLSVIHAWSIWAGADVDSLGAVEQWIADPSRGPLIAGLAYSVLVLACAALAVQPATEPPLTYRGAPTIWLAAALVIQCGGLVTSQWVLISVILGAAVIHKTRHAGLDGLVIMGLDLGVSLTFVILWPMLWATSRDRPANA